MESNGIGLIGTVFIVFLILKLTNVIMWSWWWVTAPLWGGIAIGIILFFSASLLAFIAELLKK